MSVGVTFPRVVRAEWTKLLGSRSTTIVLAVTAVTATALGAVIGHSVRQQVEAGERTLTVAGAVSAAFLPLDFVTLVIGVFGVLQMTGEYTCGLIRVTLTAVPARAQVLAAKAVALVAVTVPAALVTAVGAFAACQWSLGAAGVSVTRPGVAGAIVGAVAAPVLLGLVGLALGAVLRSTAGSITTLVVVLFLAPALLAQALPHHLRDDLLCFLPTAAAQAMYAVGGDTGNPFTTFSPGVSALVMAAWVVGLLAAGTAVLRTRDV